MSLWQKVKVKLSLCLTKHHAIKAYWEWRYSSTHSLTSALDGGEWSTSRPGRFTPREKAPGTHWIGGWVGPRAVLDAAVKKKITSPRRESNPGTPIVQPVAQHYTELTWLLCLHDVMLNQAMDVFMVCYLVKMGALTSTLTEEETFLVATTAQSDTGAHPSSNSVISRAPAPGIRRSKRVADNSPPSSAEVMNAWSFTSTSHASSWRRA
jgi:hypothetical protein